MDAQNPSAQLSMANRTPMRIGAYALAVRDLDRCTEFYRRAIGFDVLDRTSDRAVLGVSGVPLLHLEHRPGATLDDKTTAGLFHTAFVLPTRGDLANWLRHAQRIGLSFTRTGDHLINEAIYYDDPEGNGCECYADRPAESWIWHEDGTCEITTGNPVDLDALAREAGDAAAWRPPPALRIGHINLRVGDTFAAENFWCAIVGLDHTGRRDVNFMGTSNIITFMSSGRYHHHVAANDFTSHGAGPRDPDRAGLTWFAIEVEDADLLEATRVRLHAARIKTTTGDGGFEAADPWGTRVRFLGA